VLGIVRESRLPGRCLSSNCRFLYAFKGNGDTFFGCIEKVFPHEIDLKKFEAIERGKGGFGVVKVARQPLPSAPLPCRAATPPARGRCVATCTSAAATGVRSRP
jgi:hypothetical protein